MDTVKYRDPRAYHISSKPFDRNLGAVASFHTATTEPGHRTTIHGVAAGSGSAVAHSKRNPWTPSVVSSARGLCVSAGVTIGKREAGAVELVKNCRTKNIPRLCLWRGKPLRNVEGGPETTYGSRVPLSSPVARLLDRLRRLTLAMPKPFDFGRSLVVYLSEPIPQSTELACAGTAPPSWRRTVALLFARGSNTRS